MLFFSGLFVTALLALTETVASLPAKGGFTFHQTPSHKRRAQGPQGLARAYTRFGVAVPDALQKAADAQRGFVLNYPTALDAEYYALVTIGGQQFELDFDTGSTDTWVFSVATPVAEGRNTHHYYDPGASFSSKLLADQSYSITYGDGSSTSGQVYTDTFDVGGLTVSGQAFGAATNVSCGFTNDTAIDGIFGLGMDIGSHIKPTPQKGFFTNVKSTLEQPLFTVYLNHGHPGTYDFGFISPSKMITAISWVPALVSPNKGWWIVTATGYSVAGDKHVTSDYLEAVVDTGDTYLLLPQRICDQYYAKAPSVVKDHAYGYVFPCSDTLPDITLYIGGYNTTVPGWLLKGGQIDSTRCQSYLQQIAQRPGVPSAVFGDIFLKTTFTIFKYPPGAGGSPQLGFVPKAINGTMG